MNERQFRQSAGVLHEDVALDITRAFHWGLVVISEDETVELPERVRGEAVVASDFAVLALVRHAQDVEHPDDAEFLVVLSCKQGTTSRDGLAFDGEISVPSGRLTVGDADHWDTLIITPGRWRVQIDSDPVDHPARLDVWLSPAEP